ncbi:hypothetical protein BTVI_157081 [Pitangus sulphuratus]|nr:hypothetical protein BTVI_157081 [Pitangus sulphuratus]
MYQEEGSSFFAEFDRGEKEFVAQELAGLIDRAFKLAWKEERGKTRLASDEPWDGMPKFEETSTRGIPQSASQGIGYNVPHLKCFYTNACSIRNKEEELEALASLSQRFDITGVSETWWDASCNWSALLDGYRLFRRDRQGRRGRGVALYVIEGLEYTELTVGNCTVEIPGQEESRGK